MTNYLQHRKKEHAPELVTVLKERFSEDDLEIYRAWKKGAIRRIPLRVDEITKVSFFHEISLKINFRILKGGNHYAVSVESTLISISYQLIKKSTLKPVKSNKV